MCFNKTHHAFSHRVICGVSVSKEAKTKKIYPSVSITDLVKNGFKDDTKCSISILVYTEFVACIFS